MWSTPSLVRDCVGGLRRNFTRCRRLLLLGLITAAVASGRPVLAHTTGLSTSELRLGTNGLQVEIVLAGADLALALAQVEALEPADANKDGKLDAEEVAAAVVRLRTFAKECLAVEFDGRPVPPGPAAFSLDEKENFRMTMTYPGARPSQLRIRAVLFAHLPPDHLHFTAVHETNGDSIGNRMLDPQNDTLEIAPPTGGTVAAPRVNTFWGFCRLGVEHISTGYDHLLFLLALLLMCDTFKAAVQVVTFFTVAHSITLALATLNLVWVSSKVVEPAIAASIVYVGVENLMASGGPKGRWRITFLFGLVHGLGFASVLRDLGVAASATGVTVPLVAFNLGVEAGQILIAAVLLPILWQFRNWPMFLRWGVPACSAVVALAGGFWLVQRLWFA